MKDYNDKQIRDLLSAEPVPEKISPENMQKMLERKAPAKKRSRIMHRAARISAGAAACAVLCAFGAHTARQNGSFIGAPYTPGGELPTIHTEADTEALQCAAMRSAASYEELYNMLREGSSTTLTGGGYYTGGVLLEDGITNEAVDFGVDINTPMAEPEDDLGDLRVEETTDSEAKSQYSETYNQEQNVLEADIAKTDGEHIYYLYTDYSKSDSHGRLYLNIAGVSDGSFTDARRLDLTEDFLPADSEFTADSVALQDMYLYNDMLIVIGTASCYGEISYEGGICCGVGTYTSATCVNVYTTEAQPQKIASYMQDGSYNDVRITEDGYLYLITNDASESYTAIEDAEELEAYIPTRTFDGTCIPLPAEDILMPEDMPDNCYTLSYTVIGSLDLNTSGAVSECDIKAITGYAGSLYCSGSGLYLTEGYENTEITRIALENGTITPAASGSVKGYIKDQFSMSEYNGYFRIAASVEDWNQTDENGAPLRSNYVYVLDMELNPVGSIGDFGVGETIKSVSFSGEMAYVVTYEQTDPLFSIDLSDPAQPVILDEYKILGYSTYMQQWSDGLLLGFGANADENGVEDGVKLVMFDNADPTNLNEVGVHIMSGGDSYLWSEAMWERKALLIAPEKNLIGVPLSMEHYASDYTSNNQHSAYRFFSYENGQFVLKGEISKNTDYFTQFNRAVYIGDYVYTLSGDCFVAADIAGITETDRTDFS